jgi:hypothetical protein
MTKIGKKNSKNRPDDKKNSERAGFELDELCKGLYYISETDAPFTAFTKKGEVDLSPGSVAAAAGIEYREPVETIAHEAFFSRLTTEKDWFGEEDKENARRFRVLQAALEANLSNLAVYRFGRISIDIVIAGLDKGSNLVGVRTRSVET